ncbi:MAG: DUF1684 domain-containing protein [Chloroflexota bacterium]
MSELDHYRSQKDEFFGSNPQSPFTPEQQKEFTGINYFPENTDLVLALEIDEFEVKQPVEIQTTTGDLRTFDRFGKIHFEVEGEQVSLTVYATPHGYFIPFVDNQAGKETYGAGRYIDPEELPDGKILVDFNLAYNPYCAYNEAYSCPLPPAENRIPVAIQAGEKNYK